MQVGLLAPSSPAAKEGSAASSAAPSPSPSPAAFGTVPFTPARMALWLGALAVLWLVLSMLADAGQTTLARGLAALLVLGAVLGLGPRAITNAQTIFSGG